MRIRSSIIPILLPSVLAGIALFVSSSRLATAAESRPNIVYILADDLGIEALGTYGGTSYRTPQLDRQAATGIRFDRGYAQPLCGRADGAGRTGS